MSRCRLQQCAGRGLWRLILLSVLGALLAFGEASPAHADARSDYLVRKLRRSRAFRVRVQAAISLGRSDLEQPVVRALTAALRDRHPAVRTAAASSLRRLGATSALPALRRARRDRSRSVRAAVERAIRGLLARRRTTPPSRPAPSRGPARYYVGVGMPGAKSRSVDQATLRSVREFLAKEVRQLDGVEVAPANETRKKAGRVLRQRRLIGYFLDSSIVSVESTGSGVRAVVSVILGTYPGRDMRAILQGAASVPGGRGREAREQAIEGALRGAMRRLPQAMQASAARSGF